MRLLIKHALCLCLELWFSLQRGAYFQKFHGNKWSESEKCSRKSLDGKCDGYMWGLGGAKKAEILKKYLFYNYFFKAQGRLEHDQASGKCPLGGGRGRGNPTPRRLVWRFWEAWRVCY